MVIFEGDEVMNQKIVFILLLLISLTLFGCYTKFGYYEPVNTNDNQQKHVEKTEENVNQTSDSEVITTKDESDSYYGRRKRAYSTSKSYSSDSYWIPHGAYYSYYPSPYYYSDPWYYGYRNYAPYYGYSYYPYRGYYYGRYRGSTYPPSSRSTYKRGKITRDYRSGNRRSRVSRSVISSNPQSDRPQRRSNNQD